MALHKIHEHWSVAIVSWHGAFILFPTPSRLSMTLVVEFWGLESASSRFLKKISENLPITKNVLLNWYFQLGKKIIKVQMIFDVENRLWKSNLLRLFLTICVKVSESPSKTNEKKITWVVKKCLILTFKVNFQLQKSSEPYWFCS